MRESLPSLILLVLMSAVLGLTPGYAQEHTGAITGSVRDTAQGVLPGAEPLPCFVCESCQLGSANEAANSLCEPACDLCLTYHQGVMRQHRQTDCSI